ncbi:uncharacterized protein STEHIDRAFT_167150 [Stereum hirsutum FP-91666 SS1]|uniref:uncharacterized protein n=1 Tax=Stereum hirsutum (strain FP-91666) TaxID=721885 RepID=UPI000440F3D9|nr:uncharacterized protein STEHIDRAFT_167150 [Stereum hirsutum FP-91666 SS1]EIM89313.1 hypothetical protein STEHIDRAFT_167150 [Stereum hirsutum FP-91666 SS1]
MDRLPAELHVAICRDLSSGDMASLALCSHSHAALVRPLLYEHIAMWGAEKLRRYRYQNRGVQYNHQSTRFFALVTTIVSRPSFFGPFVKSISDSCFHWSSESELGELALFFQSMTNLHSLRLWFGNPAPSSEFISQIYSSTTSPSLVELHFRDTPAVPSIFDFLRSHPNLSVLRLGTVSLGLDHRNGQDESEQRSEPVPPLAQLRHLTSLELKVGRGALTFSTELLVASTHIEQLSITYSESSSGQGSDSVPNHLKSFNACGAKLNHLIIENTPHQCSQSFSWVISNILPRTPGLRILELRQPQGTDHIDSIHPQQVIRSDSLRSAESGVIPVFPKILETLRWLGAEAHFPSVQSGLSPVGASNAIALFELFPSLKVVEYHERGYVFIFRRLEDGVIKRQTVRGIPPTDLGIAPWYRT